MREYAFEQHYDAPIQSEKICVMYLRFVVPLVLIAQGCSRVISLLRAAGPTVDSLYIGPLHYNGSLLGPTYPSAGAASWFVAQWDNPQPINATLTPGPNECLDCATVWAIFNPTTRLCVSNGVLLELTQRGDSSPASVCGSEYDTFVSPNNPIYHNVVPNIIQDWENLTISNFSAVMFNFSMQIAEADTSARCGSYPQCGPSGQVDYGYAVAAVTLSNRAAQQTLFYQIILWDTRIVDCPANSPCVPFSNFFFTTLPTLGVSDSIAMYNVSCLQTGGPSQLFQLDILSRLHTALAIASSKFGADGDPAHWIIGDLYVGTGLEGNTHISSLISGISLEAHTLH